MKWIPKQKSIKEKNSTVEKMKDIKRQTDRWNEMGDRSVHNNRNKRESERQDRQQATESSP